MKVNEKALGLLICPDCKGDLDSVQVKDEIKALHCDSCKLIYPIKDGIVILLPRELRNYNLELKELQGLNLHSFDNNIHFSIAHTIKYIIKAKGISAWEWEDELYWENKYKSQYDNQVQQIWNHRVWQKEPMIKRMIKDVSLQDKTILDVGAGEGQVFKLSISNHWDNSTLYIGTDISYHGLVLNRARTGKENSLYVVCSAEDLPFRNKSINLITYFGIIHHLKKKEDVLDHDFKIIKDGGWIIMHEIINQRKALSRYLPKFLRPALIESKHEGALNRNIIFNKIKDSNLSVLYQNETCTIFLVAMVYFFGHGIEKNRIIYEIVIAIDDILNWLFRDFITFFKGSELLLLVKKDE